MREVSCVCALGVVMVGVFASSAHAQGQPEQTEAARKCFDLKQPIPCFEEGRRLYAAGDIEGAYRTYLEAWKLAKSYEVAANLGNSELKLEKWGDAYRHLRWAKLNAPLSSPPEVKQKLESRKQEALAYIAAREVVVTSKGKPLVNADVRIDGQFMGKTPLKDTLVLTPGSHTIEITAAGHRAFAKQIDTPIGTEATLNFELLPGSEGSSTSPPPTAGNPDPSPADGNVDDRDSTVSLGLGVTGLALGGVGIGVGIGLMVVSTGKGADAEAFQAQVDADPRFSANPCGEGALSVSGCVELQSSLNDQVTFQTAGIVSLVGGAAFATAGVVALLIDSDGGGPDNALLPTVSVGATTTLGLRGSF